LSLPWLEETLAAFLRLEDLVDILIIVKIPENNDYILILKTSL
jgi:hypothetical protein